MSFKGSLCKLNTVRLIFIMRTLPWTRTAAHISTAEKLSGHCRQSGAPNAPSRLAENTRTPFKRSVNIELAIYLRHGSVR